MRKEMTYDNYDALCARYDKASFKCGAWWPKIIDIKTKLEPKLEQNLEFLIWIQETADAPKTEEEKASQEYINELLKNTLVFVETKEELKQIRKENNKKSKIAETVKETPETAEKMEVTENNTEDDGEDDSSLYDIDFAEDVKEEVE